MNDIVQPNDPGETQALPQVNSTLPAAGPTGDEKLVVPLVDEYLEIKKHWEQTGEVIIRKSVESKTQSLPVDVQYEEVQIDRVPANRPLAYGEKTEPWWDGDVLVVPVVDEEIVVLKRQVLREELRIYKRRLSRRETVSDTVRSERIDIEPQGSLKMTDRQDPGAAPR